MLLKTGQKSIHHYHQKKNLGFEKKEKNSQKRAEKGRKTKRKRQGQKKEMVWKQIKSTLFSF